MQIARPTPLCLKSMIVKCREVNVLLVLERTDNGPELVQLVSLPSQTSNIFVKLIRRLEIQHTLRTELLAQLV